ncbi:protein yellow-like [Trichogramma pretiosum]|uniref:protein yellow-like n=1 Tax=Trichogramma pretiosum TaxID=7493 RepID=UPI0006C9E4DA|nr:protein yellow-like [Trichogramma pretiosum]XP_014223731.1 protein yellow-like [Trichogramma pretiosum]
MLSFGDRVCLVLIVAVTVASAASFPKAPEKLKIVYSWKSLDFAFESEAVRESALRTGRFKPGAAIPIDVDVHYGPDEPRVFVTMPRLEIGIPVTVGYVTDGLSKEGNPLIAPYPNWQWNKLGSCDALTSVYRVQVDECERVWVLDTGKVGEEQVCPPQLLSFSLRSNRLLSRYRVPSSQYEEDSLLVTPAVDVRRVDPAKQCVETYVYLADVTGFALIVYDHREQRSWKIVNNLFYPYPPHGTFEIRDENFDLMDGILGMALGPQKPNGERILYFHSLASVVESWVPTSVLRNYSLFRNNSEASPRSFQPFAMERSSQSAAEAMDRNGVMFFGLMSDLAIACWNSKHYPEFGGNNIEKLVVNEETLQFASGVKVVNGKNGRQELWVSTASFQRYMSGSLHPNETNFRIQAGFVDELVRGTQCDVTTLDSISRYPTKVSK